MNHIRPRIASLRPSDTLMINERAIALVNEGKTVYRFGFGQSPFPIPQMVREELGRQAHQKDYLPVQGLWALREAVARHQNRLLGEELWLPDNIFIGPGSKELMYLVQVALERPLLLPSPSWVSYAPQAFISDNPISWIPAQRTDWKIAASDLERHLIQQELNHCLLILNSPSNPTGAVYSEEELQDLADVCRAYSLIVISDEIYGLLSFDRKYHSLASYYPEGTIVTTGLSKWCGAGGWRLGAMMIPDELNALYDSLRALASETFSAVSAPIQYAAVAAYSDHRSLMQYRIECVAILETIAAYCRRELSAIGVHVPPSGGGFYLFPDFSAVLGSRYASSADFCHRLLEETGVALLPGTSFGRPAEELSARLSYVDFDGSVALDHCQEMGGFVEADLAAYAPKMVEGINRLVRWVDPKPRPS